MKNTVFVKSRELKGLSQPQFALKLSICSDYVNMIENNKKRTGFELAKRIADPFETTLADLFFYSIEERNVKDIDEAVRNKVTNMVINKNYIVEKCTAIG